MGKVPTLDFGLLPRLRAGPIAIANAGGMGEQIPDRDWPRGRDYVKAAIGVRDSNVGCLVLRQILADWIRNR